MRESGFSPATQVRREYGQGAAVAPIITQAAVDSGGGRRHRSWGRIGAVFPSCEKPAASEMRVEMVVPATDDHSSFALSPDGRRMAFAALDVSRRGMGAALDSHRATAARHRKGPVSPFWSPDSHPSASSRISN